MNQQSVERKAQLQSWKEHHKVPTPQQPPLKEKCQQRLSLSCQLPPQEIKPRTPSSSQQPIKRSQLNTTEGGFHAKPQQPNFKQFIQNKPAQYNAQSIVSTAFKHEKTRVEQEIDVVYFSYRKNLEIQSDKNVPIHKKKFKDDEWRRKFYNVFNREKVIDFCGNPNTLLEPKTITFNLNPLNKEGKKILQSNPKFWVVYIKLMQEKITPEIKQQLREQLIANFSHSSNDFYFLRLDLGKILDIENIIVNASQACDDNELASNKENEQPTPHFISFIDDKPSQYDQQMESLDQIRLDEEGQQNYIEQRLLNIDQQEEMEKEQDQEQINVSNDENKPSLEIKFPVESFIIHQEEKVSLTVTENQQEEKEVQKSSQVNLVQAPSEYLVVPPIEQEDSQQNHSQLTPFFFQPIESKLQTEQKDERLAPHRLSFQQEVKEVEIEEQKYIEQVKWSRKNQKDYTFKIQKDELLDQQISESDEQSQQSSENIQAAETQQLQIETQEELMQSKVLNIQEHIAQLEVGQVEEQVEEKSPRQMILDKTIIVESNIEELKIENHDAIKDEKEQEEEKDQNYEMNEECSYTINGDDQEQDIEDENQNNEFTYSKSNPKKRKRSTSIQPCQMVLRSKIKKRKLNQDDDTATFPQVRTNQTFDSQNNLEGASYLRYDILQKKEGRVLVPVRYSIRNLETDGPDPIVQKSILNQDVSFFYEPNEMEDLFAMDKQTQEIQKFLKQKIDQVERSDILEVVDSDVNKKGNFSIIKIRPECREKYGGRDQIAAALKRLSISPRKRQDYMIDMYDELQMEKRVDTSVIVNPSDDALDFIRKSSRKR